MRSLITLGICACLTSSLFSQPYLGWANKLEGSSFEEADNIIWTDNDEIIVSATFEGTMTYDFSSNLSATSQGNKDILLQRLNEDGELIWARSFGSVGEDFAKSLSLDQEGSIYLTGAFSDTMIVDQDTLISQGETDAFVLKLDPMGNLIWSFGIGGVVSDLMTDLVVDSDGNPILTFEYRRVGYFLNGQNPDSLVSNGFRDIGLIKLNNEGELIWKKTIGSTESTESPNAIQVDSLDNIFIFGDFKGTVDFHPGTGVVERTAIGTDIYILKLSKDGAFQFVKTIGSVSEQWADDMSIQDGYLAMTGGFKGTLNTIPAGGDTVLEANGFFDCYIIKMSIDGNFQWVRAMGDVNSDTGLSVDISPEGNVMTCGFFITQMDLDPGPGEQIATGNPDRRTMYIQSLNPDGDLVWASEFVGVADGFMRAISIRDDGYFVGCGSFNGNTDLAPFEAQSIIQGIPGDINGFIARYDPCRSVVIQDTVSTCTTYLWNGIEYDTTGLYVQEFPTASICDSIVERYINIQESLTGLLEMTACDSTMINGISYFESGTYQQELTTQDGCDSTLTISLEISMSDTVDIGLSACYEIEYNGVNYTQSGEYQQSFQNSLGCDSVIHLSIDIMQPVAMVLSDGMTLNATSVGDSYSWLNCDEGLELIQGENQSTFTPDMDGNYALMITEGACSDTSECIFIDALGLEDFELSSALKIFPNPTRGILNIESSNQGKLKKVAVYDMLGQNVLTTIMTHAVEIDISHLENGLYSIIVTEDGSSSQHLVTKL